MRAVFLDRDGVICENRPDHVKGWAEFRFLPGTLAALRRLARQPWPLVVITNQGAVRRGLVSAAAVEEIHARMLQEVRRAGGRLDAIYYCPHLPEEGCFCRKPRPGLLFRAAQDLGIDLEGSYFIGDAVTDVEAALAAGCQPILVQTGRGAAHRALVADRYPSVPILHDLPEAVAWIMGREALRVLAPTLRGIHEPAPLG